MTDRQTTHAPGCWSWGPRHYECALREIERDEAMLRQALDALEVSTRFVYADLRPQCESTIDALRERLHEQLRLSTVDQVNAEAEANDARAEIEALRAEVEGWKSVAEAQAALHDEAEDHAEALAKALAELITWIPSADTYRRLGFDPEAPMRALKRAKLSIGSIGGLRHD